MFRFLIAMTLLALLAACGDDSGDDATGDGAGDGGAAAAGEGVIWMCVCRGMLEVDGGPPLTSMEDITECAVEDPTEMLSERYDRAAREAGPGQSGVCDTCEATEEACTPSEE